MHLVIYEDSLWTRLAPRSLSRPVCLLTLGSKTLLERAVARLKPTRVTLWVRPELEKLSQQQALRFNIPIAVNQPLDQEPFLLLNARTAVLGTATPPEHVSDTTHPHALRYSGSVPAIGPSDPLNATDAWRRSSHSAQPEPIGRLAHSLADLIHWNHEAIMEDFADAGSATAAMPSGPFHLVDEARIRLGQDVHLEPGCVIDASCGPILLSDRVTVGAGAVLKGPCTIGPCTVIAPHALVRPGTSIGANCRIGGEVSASIILSHSNKAHEGYLGHSYLGEWVNLGAGTTTSNLKNTYGEVVLKVGARRVPTGRQFLGSLVGDHSKTGILTRLMTGTYIGYCSMLAASTSPPSSVPSLTFITDAGHAAYRLDKAAEVARRVYQRRGKEWTADDEALMHYVARIAPHVEAERAFVNPMAWQHENETDEDDPENPGPEDMDDSDDPEIIDCQYCGQSISEEAEQCPHCGNYISVEDAPYDKKWWIVIGAVLLVIATLMWLWISGSTNPRPLIP